jgi:hypothetical protein
MGALTAVRDTLSGMPRRAPVRVVAFTVAALVATVAPRAHGKGSLQGTAEVGVGATDNVFNAPYPNPGQSPACDPETAPTPPGCLATQPLPRFKDVFFELRPGIVFTTGAARAVQQLGYNFAADLFVKHPQGNSYTNTINWAGVFLPSPKTELLLALQSQQGRSNTLNLQSAANATDVQIQRLQSTNTTYFSQSATQSLLDHITDRWSFAQALAFNAFIPIDPRTIADNYSTTLDLGGERLFKIDAIGLDLRSQYIVYGETVTIDPGTNMRTPNPVQHQLINSLTARWRRDWTRFWSTEAAIGPLEASILSAGSNVSRKPQWQPYALAAVRYTRERGNGELRYEHNALPSPLSGSTYAIDAVTLRAVVPFPEKSRVTLALTAGYNHGQLLLTDPSLTPAGGVAQPTAEVLLGDLSLSWQALTWLGVFARYEVNRQWGHASDLGSRLPDIFRNLGLIGVTAVYPTQAAAQVARTPGLRIDRADTPLIPEPHSQPVMR